MTHEKDVSPREVSERPYVRRSKRSMRIRVMKVPRFLSGLVKAFFALIGYRT